MAALGFNRVSQKKKLTIYYFQLSECPKWVSPDR